MTDTDPTYAALLAAVVARPEDDAPRLIMADWLEENGDEARAEFIRVQCELAKLGPPHHVISEKCSVGKAGGPGYYDVTLGSRTATGMLCTVAKVGDRVDILRPASYTTKPLKPLYGLRVVKIDADSYGNVYLAKDEQSKPWPGERFRRRERELLDQNYRRWVPFAGWGARANGEVLGGIGPLAVFRRGFVSSVSLTCAEFVSTCHGTGRSPGLAEPLFRACPTIEAVRLTDREPAHYNDGGMALWYWEPGIMYSGPHQIPFPLGELLDVKATFDGGLMVYPFLTPELANKALSDAAMRLGRTAAKEYDHAGQKALEGDASVPRPLGRIDARRRSRRERRND